ncbi:MAG TPA: hypothetical protein VIP09_10270 [Dehalococcoidia bacterium]|jgi:hypothetical protein
MATQIDLLKAKIASIERQLEIAKRDLTRLEKGGNGETPGKKRSFAELRGIWKGTHFTEEEIDAVKIRSRDLD